MYQCGYFSVLWYVSPQGVSSRRNLGWVELDFGCLKILSLGRKLQQQHETSQIQVNPNQVHKKMRHPVQRKDDPNLRGRELSARGLGEGHGRHRMQLHVNLSGAGDEPRPGTEGGSMTLS